MSKAIKFVRSRPFVKGMEVPPCPFPEAGVIDPALVYVVTDPTSARYDSRIDESIDGVTEGLLTLGVSLRKEKQIVAITTGWLPLTIVYEDDTTEDIWGMEAIDGRRRRCGSIKAGIKAIKYSRYEDAHLLPDWRLNELAVAANTARLNYTPEQIAEKAPGMVAARLAQEGKVSKKRESEIHEDVARLLGVSPATLKLIMDNWRKASTEVKAAIEEGSAPITVLRDIAPLPEAAQGTVLAVAKDIEATTGDLKAEAGKGGKRAATEVTTDSVRLARAIVLGEKMPETLTERDAERTKAAETVAAKVGVKIKKSDRLATAIDQLSGWLGNNPKHDDTNAAITVLAVLEWVRTKGEDMGALSSMDFASCLKAE